MIDLRDLAREAERLVAGAGDRELPAGALPVAGPEQDLAEVVVSGGQVARPGAAGLDQGERPLGRLDRLAGAAELEQELRLLEEDAAEHGVAGIAPLEDAAGPGQRRQRPRYAVPVFADHLGVSH